MELSVGNAGRRVFDLSLSAVCLPFIHSMLLAVLMVCLTWSTVSVLLALLSNSHKKTPKGFVFFKVMMVEFSMQFLRKVGGFEVEVHNINIVILKLDLSRLPAHRIVLRLHKVLVNLILPLVVCSF